MLTIEDRNKIAISRMRGRFQEMLNIEIPMTIGDIAEYTQISTLMSNLRFIESYAELTCFLLQNIECDCSDEITRRYKTAFTTEGLEQTLNDWDNRYEMGK